MRKAKKARKRDLTRTQLCRHPDLGLLASELGGGKHILSHRVDGILLLQPELTNIVGGQSRMATLLLFIDII